MNLQVFILGWIIFVSWQTIRDYPRWRASCIIKVLDGDTFQYTFEGEQKGQIHIGRLWRIDAFELAQKPWGKISTQKLIHYLKYSEDQSQATSCQKIYVKFIKKEYYGRNLILVKKHLLESKSINEKLVASGWALIYPSADWMITDKAQWKKNQDQAKQLKKGIWKYSKKYWQTPWRFRKST